MNALIAAAFNNESVDQNVEQDLDSQITESVVQKLNFDEVKKSAEMSNEAKEKLVNLC